jgi:hypothetical protein
LRISDCGFGDRRRRASRPFIPKSEIRNPNSTRLRLLIPKSEIRNPKSVPLLLSLLLLLSAGCAARRPRTFAPAGEAETQKVLAAWREAVERAESLPPSRLLYEARLSQGLARVPGTLAVVASRRGIEASLTGAFGSPVATYSEGALRGEGIRPIAINPQQLRALLAGAWDEGTPEVRGVEGGDGLLVWKGDPRVEGVLDVARSRFRSLDFSRADGKIAATYSGEFNPWPSHIEVEDAATRGRLRLSLLAVEPLEESGR